jgi:hypothetical protein
LEVPKQVVPLLAVAKHQAQELGSAQVKALAQVTGQAQPPRRGRSNQQALPMLQP